MAVFLTTASDTWPNTPYKMLIPINVPALSGLTLFLSILTPEMLLIIISTMKPSLVKKDQSNENLKLLFDNDIIVPSFDKFHYFFKKDIILNKLVHNSGIKFTLLSHLFLVPSF